MKSRRKQYSFRFFDLPVKGSILVLAVWIMVFFSILGVGLYNIVSSQIRLAKSMQERALCPHLAKSAYLLAKAQQAGGLYDNNTLFGQRKKREQELGRGKFIFSLIDEESKINLNTSDVQILASLPGSDDNLAVKIIQLKGRLNGYFVALEEVLLLNEITLEEFEEWKKLVTVYGNGKININTAGTDVMKVLGFDESLISSIIDFRSGPDAEEATEDDESFSSAEQLFLLPGLSQAQLDQISRAQGMLGAESENFALQIETFVLDRPAINYSIVTDFKKIKRWTEK